MQRCLLQVLPDAKMKPQSKHLQTRVDGLLRHLKLQQQGHGPKKKVLQSAELSESVVTASLVLEWCCKANNILLPNLLLLRPLFTCIVFVDSGLEV